MLSPQSSLRRRGRGSISESSGHARTESDGFGSFVDSSSAFPASFEATSSNPLGGQATSSSVAFASPTRTRADSASRPPANGAIVEDVDDWADADMVSSFSPVEQHFPTHLPSAAPSASSPKAVGPASTRPPARRKVSGTGVSSEWADWNSFLAAHTLPTQQSQPQASDAHPKPPPGASNPADDAFLDAFEVATNPTRAPSPPIIDLREVEKKLDRKKLQQQKQAQPPDLGSADDDFFSRFERAPQTALGRSNPLVLEPEQLESMHDARTSPMPTSPSAPRRDSYFGAAAQPKPIAGSGEPKKEAAASSLSPASPSSWTGSLRKTWTTLRGIQSEIASHLPSASDFIVPADEVEGETAHAGAVDSNPGGGLLFATDAPEQSDIELGRRHSGSSGTGGLPHASDYSQGTPFAPHASTSAFSSGAATSASKHGGAASLRARDLFASPSAGSLGVDSLSSSGTLRRGPVHAATAPISGAPGFDARSEKKWNTGHWTLDERGDRERRAIDVVLSGRRDETEVVVEAWHAARLQALLPPRLQLGKRWSLLYSLDQHGISLQTLYNRVASGLDPTKSARSVSGAFGEDSGDAEGWLRGASRETQQAMGTRAHTTMHVGGGLSSISDAGLVLALKDGDDNVFGAFVNEKLRPQQHYYGSGECFLWKTTRSGKEAGVERFRWTGKNDYMVLSESTFLSVGGGEGKFGLWVDGALEKGVSACCPAFDNEVLCDAKPRGQGQREGEKRFECYGLEVWAVGID